MKILIFDLDLTIDSATMRGLPKKKVLAILEMAKRQGWYVYVVTARRLRDFDGDWEKLCRHNVSKDVIDKIFELNEGAKSHRYWLFYTEDTEEPTRHVDQLLNRGGKGTKQYTQKRKAYNNFVEKHFPKDPKDPGETNRHDQISLHFGIFKMMQIESIVKLHNMLGNKVSYNDVFFFDDSFNNYLAWIFVVQYLNEDFKDMHFIGGKDAPVFSNITDEEFNEVMQPTTKTTTNNNFLYNNSSHIFRAKPYNNNYLTAASSSYY